MKPWTTIFALALILSHSVALAQDRTIDAVIADLKAKAARCAGQLSAVGQAAADCVRTCEAGANMVQTRFADRGRAYDERTKPVIDLRAVDPCNLTLANAEAPLGFPTIPDIEGLLTSVVGDRQGFSVRVEGRDDWTRICGNGAHLKNTGEFMQALRAAKAEQYYVRFEGISYDPSRVGQSVRSPCTAARGIILGSN